MKKGILPAVLLFTIVLSILFFSCEKELSCENCNGTNTPPPVDTAGKKPPVANAGADLITYSPPSIGTLDGTLSVPGSNPITGYSWANISGPSSPAITSPDLATTSVAGLTEGVYVFVLTVTDAAGLSSKDSMQMTVKKIPVLDCDPNRQVIQAHLVPFGKLSDPRYYMQTISAGNKILFAGGIDSNGYSTRVDIFDVGNNSWSTAELSRARQGMAVIASGNQIFFAGGGENSVLNADTRVDIYDAGQNNWKTAELSLGREYLSAAGIGDNIYFTGGGNWGSGNFTGTAQIDIYNTVSGSWSTDMLPEQKVYHTTTAVGNKLYVAGGVDGQNTISSTVDVYDATLHTWTNFNMNEARYVHGSITVNNMIYWASGGTQGGESNQVEIYDVATGLTTSACVFPKEQFGVVTKDNKIVFFTGHQAAAPVFDIYDLSAKTWATGVLDINLSSATIISVNNVIYVAGGMIDGTTSTITNGVWKLEF